MITYRQQYTNTENQVETIDIIDNDSVTTSVIPIDGGGALVETVNNDEDKFYPIRARAITIQFWSTNTVNLNTFCDGTDQRWGVHKYTTNQTIFKGFLVLDDMSEDFQDPQNLVTLTATDNLGTLKDVPFTKPDGTNPTGHIKIIDALSWIFQKTNQQLPIYTVHNIMEEDYEGEPMYKVLYVDAKTFEGNDLGTMVDCYRALEIILGHDAFTTQENGIWWVIRPDELDSASIRIWLYDYLGAYVAFQSATTYTQTIEQAPGWIGAALQFSQDGALVSPVRAYKKVILTYNYEPPKEIICNMDFTRGEPIDDVLPLLTYTIECWTHYRDYGTARTTPTGLAFIQKRFNDLGYETERYAVITPKDFVAPEYIESEFIDVHSSDKFTFSVDFRWESNGAGPNAFVGFVLAGIRIEGDDSTYWSLLDQPAVPIGPVWVQTDSNNVPLPGQPVGTGIGMQWNPSEVDETEWVTVSTTATSIPVDGKLYINLFSMNQVAPAGAPDYDDVAVYYQNLQFSYIPFINSTYQTYRGQSHIVTNAEDMKAVRDKQVFLSDSPRKLFKGALKKEVAGKYVLAGLFYNGAVILGSPTTDDLHPFGWHQVQAVWNQYNRTFRNFEFTAQGLKTDTDRVPDMIHKYFIGDSSDHSDNKQFMLLHMSQDHVLCEWKGFLAEIFDSTIPKSYDDQHEFKYITER